MPGHPLRARGVRAAAARAARCARPPATSATRPCSSTQMEQPPARRAVARRRAALPQPRVPRRHPGRPRQHQRRLRRRHQDQLRHLPALRLFHSGVLGAEAVNTKALIFNVKGEDLLFLDHPNIDLDDDQRRPLRRARPAGRARSSASASSPRRGATTPPPRPTSPAAPSGVTSFFWTIDEFCRQELLPFLFADAEDDRQQYTMVVHNVTARLRATPSAVGDGGGRPSTAGSCARFASSSTLIDDQGSTDDGPRTSGPAGPSAPARSTPSSAACTAPCATSRHLVRADVAQPDGPPGRLRRGQVTVVDLHNLNDRAKRFVVGVVLRKAFERKERSGQARPLQFVVLDELNKYAPRDGSSPIKEILLDVAERGRSLGIILIGAQQTASEVERRIVANSAIRVVGRLDSAEAARGEYGFLPAGAAPAGHDPQARHDARVASPSCRSRSSCSSRSRRGPPGRRGRSPGPLRAASTTRSTARRRPDGRREPTTLRRSRVPFRGGGTMKSCTPPTGTSARPIRGRSRADEHAAVLAEIAGVADARDGRPRARGRRPVRHRRAHRPRPSASSTGRCSTWRPAAAAVVVIAGNHDNAGAGWRAVAPLFDGQRRARARPPIRPPDDGGVVELDARDGAAAAVALLPFLSQRYVVTADDLHGAATPPTPTASLRRPGAQHPAARSPPASGADTVNLVAAHLMVMGGTMGGGERGAHTVFDYWVPATAFPATAQYVALGHLHRAQQLAGPAPAPLLRLAAPARLRRDGQRAGGHRRRRAGPGKPGRRRGRSR